MSKQKLIIIILAVFLIAGGGGFFAGVKYQQSRRVFPALGQGEQFTGQMRGNPGAAGRQGNPGQALGARPLSGKVISRDEKSLTIELPDGGSKIILLSEGTFFKRMENASGDDLAVGSNVLVLGQENSDGSVSAQSVQIENAVVEEKE